MQEEKILTFFYIMLILLLCLQPEIFTPLLVVPTPGSFASVLLLSVEKP